MTWMDRRALFTSGAAAALLAASGLSAATPRAGGRLRLALPRDGDSFDQVWRAAVFDTLTEVAPNGVLRGELATSWSSSSDARVWEFELRSDVAFQDGTAFGATDVVESLFGAETGAEIGVVHAEATDSHHVRVDLSSSNPDLPYLLAEPSLVMQSISGQGTGLYRPERLESGRHFLGQRVRQHYKDGQAGWLDSVEIIVIPDAKIRAEALRDGFVDVAELPEPKGLRGRGEFVYHPSRDNMALAARAGVGVPKLIGARGPLDDGRISERWWIG
ncbi:MAG: peptide ABC transporter substrate-binding protein [Rhodobacteraceae bacterium]|nr:peptide ABC transporter substrate-binding protein [Paracoccaceae bacterium]